MTTSPPAGWYADPQGPAGQNRWWDGARWTDQTAPAPTGPPSPAAGPASSTTSQFTKPSKKKGRLPTWAKWALGVLALLIVIGAVAGESEDTGDDNQAQDTPATEAPREVTIETIAEDGTAVEGKSVLVSGTVSEPGAKVEVENKEVTADADGEFQVRISLPKVGDNSSFVTARKPGFEPDSMSISITRELTAKERAIRAERRRVARERAAERRRLAREAELAELRNSAVALDPGQFQKDPDRYTGQNITMTGQIFQIQEGGPNFFLMTTECDTSYGATLCTGPDVYVSYAFPTDKTEEDVVTVYGTVRGGYEYDTAAGGSAYVGHLRARIID